MATIDPSIALGVKPLQLDNPMNAMAMYSQIQGAQQANQLNQMKMAEYERARGEEEGIRNYLAGGVDLNAPEGRAGLIKYGKTGLEYGKLLSEQDKSRAELTEKRLKVAAEKTSMFRDALADVNSPQQAAAWLTAQHQDPDLKPIVSNLRPLDQALQNIPTNPADFAKWKQMNGLGMTKFIERNTMTAAEKATDARAGQRLAQEAQAVTYQTDGDGNIVAVPTKLAPGAVPTARAVIAPGGGMQPLKAKDSSKTAVSEQQASYNIGRVLTAAKEIGKIVEKNPSVLKPGAGEALASSVGLTGTANAARSADRQIVYGAQRDALDALLYLATGAAYNKEQLQGQMAAYIPAYTDEPEAVAAKQVRMAELIKSAKTRAGKSWTPEMESAMQSLTNPAGTAAGAVDTSNPLLK